MVVWGFFGDGYVVNVVFLNVCIVDVYEFSFGMQQVNGIIVGQIYIGMQIVYLLVNDFFQVVFIGYVVFDIFWYQFVSGVIVLEIVIRGVFGYCVKGVYFVVGFVRVILIEFDFIWGFFGICQYGVNYYCCCIGGDCFGDIVGEMDIVVSDNWNIGFFQCFYCVGNSSDLWYIYVGDDMGSIDGVWVDVYFYCVVVGFCQCVCVCVSGNVVVDDLQVRIFCVCFMDMLQNVF